jgi:hypothetical protein
VFDDVKKFFDFERLFSVVTEGLTLEKKNKDAIKIPFEKSPKIAITTNYAISGSGNSFMRRKWELELHQYYNKDFTPLDEFGKLMFGDWNDDDWCIFDNYMIRCLQNYLNTGLVKSKFVNLNIRQLGQATSNDFIEWCGLTSGSQPNEVLIVDQRLRVNDVYYRFIEDYPDYQPRRGSESLTRIKFNRWLRSYAVYLTGKNPEEGRDAVGKWMRFKTAEEN